MPASHLSSLPILLSPERPSASLKVAGGRSPQLAQRSPLGLQKRQIPHEESVSPGAPLLGRKVERGVLGTPRPDVVYLWFERFPIWLLTLSTNRVSQVWLMGVSSQAGLVAFCHSLGLDHRLIASAIRNLGSDKVHYTANLLFLPEGALFLVSGSRSFVRAWSREVPNPMLLLCDEHIRAANCLHCRGSLQWVSV